MGDEMPSDVFVLQNEKKSESNCFDADNEKQSQVELQRVKAKERTLYVSYFSLFLSFVSFSITLPSLWQYMKAIDPSVKESYLGWTSSVFCFSQFVACIIFGYWHDKQSATKPMYLTSILLFIGNVVYMFANSFGRKGIYVIIVARAILGTSTGNVAVVRAIGAELSTVKERAKVMVLISLSQGLGILIGPVLQAAVRPIGEDGLYIAGLKLNLNIYTVPCLLMMVFGILLLVLQYVYLEDGLKHKEQIDDKASITKDSGSEMIDMKAVVLSIFFWFTTATMFAIIETLVSPSTLNEFAWTKPKSVFYSSLILGGSGVITVSCFLVVVPLSKKLEDRKIILIGLVFMIVGMILLLPWGPDAHVLTPKNSNSSDVVGCPYEYSWCHDTPAIPLAQFLVAIICGMIGFSFCVVTAKILLSRVIGPYPQGKFMGWYSAAGSIARSLAPIYISFIYQYYGLRWGVVGLQLLLCISFILMACFWKRLVPFGKFKRDKKTYERL